MSQYLNIFLKKKGTEISIRLSTFCTTPARQISSLGAFPYTDIDILLTQPSVESYLKIITEERDKYKESLERETRKKAEVKQDLYMCTSREVAQMFSENIKDIEQYIYELEELVDEWNWIIYEISFILTVWKENQEEWELYYHNR